MPPKPSIKLGDVFKDRFGNEFEVIEYRSAKDVLVKFKNTGFIRSARADHVRSGAVVDPMRKSVYGKAYLGQGEYKLTDKAQNMPSTIGSYWKNMLSRVYNTGHTAHRDSLSLCEEWHNYQEFARWFISQKPNEIANNLDKDIIQEGNMLYSPNTCCLVPKELNTIFRVPYNTAYPTGVRPISATSFCASMSMGNSRVYLGSFKSMEEAAFKVKETKLGLITSLVLDKYREFLLDSTVEAILARVQRSREATWKFDI